MKALRLHFEDDTAASSRKVHTVREALDNVRAMKAGKMRAVKLVDEQTGTTLMSGSELRMRADGLPG